MLSLPPILHKTNKITT